MQACPKEKYEICFRQLQNFSGAHGANIGYMCRHNMILQHPACVYVNQDGIQWNAPTVFDNLIYSKEMPVTIGVFVNPGIVKAQDTSALDRYTAVLNTMDWVMLMRGLF
jgi:hypothetical protein